MSEILVILSELDIKAWVKSGRLEIEPFEQRFLFGGGIQLRPSGVIKRLRETRKPIDRENENLSYSREEVEGKFTVNPHERILFSTVERMKMPEDLVGFIELRSFYSRAGISIPPTKIDPRYEGHLTILLIGSSFPVEVSCELPIIHVMFARLTGPSQIDYDSPYVRVGSSEPLTTAIPVDRVELVWCDLEKQVTKQKLIVYDRERGKLVYECVNDKTRNEFVPEELF